MTNPISSKKRRQVLPVPPPSSHGRPPASSSPSSSRIADSRGSVLGIDGRSGGSVCIPLPKTHIRRTPSELQLADEVRRAERDDVRMYARLVVGMKSQIQRDYRTNGGVVNPLSRKSLEGVVRTKQANYDDLDASDRDTEGQGHVDLGRHGSWRVSHVEGDAVDSLDSPWSSFARCDSNPTPSKYGSDGSLSTRESMGFQGAEVEVDDEDDFVFCLEL
jgi:hypothetical protein